MKETALESSAYAIAGPSVLYDMLDGEAVVLHMNTGLYYSLRGVAADIWLAACARQSVPDIVQGLTRCYSGERDRMETEVIQFLASLQKESLLVSAEPLPATTVPEVADKPPFVTPEFLRYDDMDDLLLLDPIHDTEAAGWPSARTSSPAPS